jgi:hypothetical protein
MRSKLCFIILFIFLSGIPSAWSQSISESFIEMNKETLDKSYPDERVLIITDREIYLCGEEIFFHAFTYEGNWFLPVSISSVLYAELYNKNNQVISRVKFPLINGNGSGKILIPRSILSDIYFIRAYTNFMKNFGPQQFFMQKLKIVNPFINYIADYKTDTTREIINCQIFPEGGKLISGVKNIVGCRFTDARGRSAIVNASVLDMNKDIVTRFQTYKEGFAKFELTPKEGYNYSIEAVSSKTRAEMPIYESLKTGVVLSVDTLTSDTLIFRISSAGNNNFPSRLIARHGEFIYPLDDTLLNRAGINYVSRNILPAGLISLELIDAAGETLAKRMVYINPPEKFKIALNTDKKLYLNREEVNLMISTSDNKGLPVITDLVFMATLSEDEYTGRDISFFNKGFLFRELSQTSLYDDETITNAVADEKLLDLLLLASPEPSGSTNREGILKYLPETTGDIISGKLVYADNQPAEGIEILQSFTGKASCIESSVTGPNGNFRFLLKNEKNRGDLILKVQNAAQESTILLDDEFFSEFAPLNEKSFKLTKEEIDLITREFINIQVEDAFSSEKINKSDNYDSDVVPFYGKDYIEYKFSDYAKLPNMKEFIFEIIVGVVASKENKKDVINILGEDRIMKIGPLPLMIIDGVPVTEASIVFGLNPEKVISVKVKRNKYFYKDQIFDGILDIITESSDTLLFDLPKDTFRYSFIHTEIRNPEVETQFVQSNDDRIPVYKNLLLWKPKVQTDKYGKAVVSFTTPDNSGSYTIQCFGFSPQGLTGGARTTITVGMK